jgi:hypothetical protein
MQRAALLALAIGAAPGAPSCGVQAAAATLAALGRPSLQLVDPLAGARLAAAGDAVLQARGEGSADGIVPAALAVRDGEPLAEAPAGRRFVVVSAEPELALRLGARLARAGAAQVAVVSGGLPAWGPPHQGLEPTEE